MRNIPRIICSAIIVFGAMAIAALFISPELSSWYAGLIKPSYTPPDQLLIPLWIFAAILQSIALARVWMQKESVALRRWAFTFLTQLLLNALGAVLFFNVHAITLSTIVVIVMWFAVIIMTLDSWKIDRLAFWVLIPYFVWVTLLSIWTIQVWWVN